MSSYPIVRVGGVPEHFNYPWHLAAERGLYEKHGVRMVWIEQKEGTGQMIKSVRWITALKSEKESNFHTNARLKKVKSISSWH